jgi:uncharacterized protein YceK
MRLILMCLVLSGCAGITPQQKAKFKQDLYNGCKAYVVVYESEQEPSPTK